MEVQGIFTDIREETVRLNKPYGKIKKSGSKHLDYAASMNNEVKIKEKEQSSLMLFQE